MKLHIIRPGWGGALTFCNLVPGYLDRPDPQVPPPGGYTTCGHCERAWFKQYGKEVDRAIDGYLLGAKRRR